MESSSDAKLIRRLRDHHDAAALGEFAPLAPELGEISDCLGSALAPQFILQHVDQFPGSTVEAFRQWLGKFTREDLTGWWIGRIKAGDKEAWNYWLVKNRPRLVRYAKRRGVGPGHGADASDVVQIATWEVDQSIKDFRGRTEAELLAVLYQRIYWRANDFGREPTMQQLPPAPLASDGSTPSQSVVRREAEEPLQSLRRKKKEQIHAARGCLAEQELQVFEQREVGGRLLKTIAADLGLTTVETAKLFYQARNLLQGKVPLLDQDDGTPASGEKQRVRSLTARQRQAIELKDVEEYSLKEIGDVMGCSAAAVGSLIYRGVNGL